LPFAVESVDTFSPELRQSTLECLDLFVRVIWGEGKGTSIILVYTKDWSERIPEPFRPASITLFLCSDKILEVVGELIVLTRWTVRESQSIYRDGIATFFRCIMYGGHGAREIALYFYTRQHARRFSFALQTCIAGTPKF